MRAWHLGALALLGAAGGCSRRSAGAATSGGPAVRVIEIHARRFSYQPAVVKVKRGEVVELALSSLDRVHGFNAPELNIREDVAPGRTTRIKLQADKIGTFLFHCDVFCGDGHEDMAGQIVVEP